MTMNATTESESGLSILNWILENMETVNKIVEPEGKVKENENVVGQMTEAQKRLYSLTRQEMEKLHYLAVKIRFGDREDREARTSEAMEMKGKIDLMERLLWADIRETNMLWASSNIGFREGFTIVEYEDPHLGHLEDFFQQLFGGGMQ